MSFPGSFFRPRDVRRGAYGDGRGGAPLAPPRSFARPGMISPGSGARLRLSGTGAALAGLAVFLATSPAAMAQTCKPAGTGTLPTATYDGASYDSGIRCTGMSGGLTLTVAPPDGGTTVTSEQHGIHVRDTNRAPGAISVNVEAGVKIGTQENPVGKNGIEVAIQGSPDANTAKISVDNAGSIRTKQSGIRVTRNSPGDVTVTNSGTIVTDNPDDSVKEGGILVRNRKKGHAVINHSGSVTSGWHAAIYAWYQGEAAAADGSIRITSSGTVRSMVKHGILAQVDNTAAAIPATVTVTGGKVHGTDDGIRVANEGNGSSTARVSGSARIESDKEDGIHATAGKKSEGDEPGNFASEAPVLVDLGAGATIFTRNSGGEDDESSHGIHAEHFGNQAIAGTETDTGSIRIVSAGKIETAGTNGHGIAAFATGTLATVPIEVEMKGGSITAAGDGIHVENKGRGKVAVTVGQGATVTSKKHGIVARVDNTAAAAPATVTVTGGKVHSTDDGIRVANEGNGSSTVRVSGSARIESDKEDGIHATAGKKSEGDEPGNFASEAPVLVDLGAGATILTRNSGGEDDESSHGIHVRHFGNQAIAGTETDTGSIRIVSAGKIETAGANGHGIAAFATGTLATVPIEVEVKGGSITTAGDGIHVENKGRGKVAVTVGRGATVTSKKHGIVARVDNTSAAAPATVTVTGGKVHGTDDGIRVANEGNGSSTARVSGSARIESDKEDGIHATAGKKSEGDEPGNSASEAPILVDLGAGATILTRNSGGEDDESSHGIHVRHFGNQAIAGTETDTGSIRIVSAGKIETAGANGHGIAAFATGTLATVPIEVEVKGGSITAAGDGIHVENKGRGKVAVTVGRGAAVTSKKHGIVARVDNTSAAAPATVTVTGGKVHGTDDGIRVANEGNGSSTVRISGSARIESDKEDGIHATAGKKSEGDEPGNFASEAPVLVDLGAGATILTRNSGGEDDESSHGIHVRHFGNQAIAGTETDTGSIRIVSAGKIETAGANGYGIAAFAAGTLATVPIEVEVKGGSITAAGDGIHVENKGRGKVAVTVDQGVTVTSKKDGIRVDGALIEGEMRAQTVTVRGKVMGGGGEYAGVHMVEGGTVVIGTTAHVGAQSGTAIKANAPGDMTVILEKNADGPVGQIDGTILNTATTTFKIRTGGVDTTLAVGGMVDWLGETKGVHDAVHQFKLVTTTGGHKLEEQPQSRLYHDRARVYEALPSVLLELNRQASYHERMAAPRGANGAWVRFGGGDGARKPGKSTTSKGFRGRALSWDFEHWGIEAGFDRPVDERLTLGLSVHHRQGEATVKHGGTVEASGMGFGLSATYAGAGTDGLHDGLYVDGRFSWTRLDDIELASRARGKVASGLSGTGFAVGVEAGRRMALKGPLALTPRASIAWSSVDADSFDDVAGVAGSGKVTLGKAKSFTSSLGVLAETGSGAGAVRAFASLDMEHDFSSDRSVTASGTELASQAKATWLRLGLGAAANLDAADKVTLSGNGFYATAGGDNTDLGAAVSLGIRF